MNLSKAYYALTRSLISFQRGKGLGDLKTANSRMIFFPAVVGGGDILILVNAGVSLIGPKTGLHRTGSSFINSSRSR